MYYYTVSVAIFILYQNLPIPCMDIPQGHDIKSDSLNRFAFDHATEVNLVAPTIIRINFSL